MNDGVQAEARTTWGTVDLADEPLPPLSALRKWAARTLRGLDEEHVHAVQLVLTELVTNAYEHGAGADEVRLSWTRDPCRVGLEVDDRSERQPVPRDPAPDARDGRGLQMIGRLAETWGTCGRDGGKTVHASIECGTYPWTPCETERAPG